MYFDKLYDLGIKLTRRSGNVKTKCPQCSDGRKNKTDTPLSVNITEGEYNCFAGETRVITSKGVFSIQDIIGIPVSVLDGNGNWVETYFKKYGISELYEINVSRNGHLKTIYATDNHRWFVRENVKDVVTKNLISNQRLKYIYSKPTHKYVIVENAVQHGFVFGDGCLENKHRHSRAYFCGSKDEEMMQYFNSNNPVYVYSDKIVVGHLPKEYKSFPSLSESNDYLFSWLAGYFAADGDVAENGLAIINSSKKYNLEFIREVCNKIGIGTFSISEYDRNGYGGESKIFRLSFISSTLNSDFFLISNHKKRFDSFNKLFERKRWVIKSVKKTERIEDVYCCNVETTHSFALEDNILTGNCHNCGWKGNVRAFERKREQKKYVKPEQSMMKIIERKEKTINWFKNRGISETTLEKFMIFNKEEFMPQTSAKENCICFPYFRDGEIVNVKYRDAKKNFKLVKDAELIFYNLSAIGEKKSVVIVEGEIDCLSVYEAGYGQTYDKIIIEKDEATGEVLKEENNPLGEIICVSVPNGASKGSQRLDYLDNCADWFIGLHEIIIATDNDEAGKMLKDELIRRLGVERCKTISYPIEEVVPLEKNLKRRCKDLNEVLMYLGRDVVKNVINNAESIPVDGVYYLEDIFDSMLDNFRKGIILAPTTNFTQMDEYFRWKKGDITLCTGYGNHGKSFFMLQLMLTKSIYDDWKWAIFSPENFPANDFYDDIIEMYVGKWLNNMTEDEYVDACIFIDQHFFYVYPDDEHDINSIHEKFRHLILKKGVDGVMIDPFNQLDSNQKAYQREDQYLSEILKDVKRFALLNNVVYVIVAHPKNPSHRQGEALPVVDMYDIAGGAMWGNKADQILSYYRPNFHVNKNDPDVTVFVQKLKRKRTGGQLGQFDLTLLWSKKRYSDPMKGETPCDPLLVKNNKLKADNNYVQPQLTGTQNWLPYKDKEEDAPF